MLPIRGTCTISGIGWKPGGMVGSLDAAGADCSAFIGTS
nr:MAG TPA: hypothetical protein [Caudoviricetes sp.]